MSELINKSDDRTTIRWKLLTGVSALALTAYVSSTGLAKAEDADHPQIWIEFGGQLEQIQGLSAPFTAPFMNAVTPTPDVYANDIFTANQKPNKWAFSEEGALSFQPEGSDWIFSADIKFGRSQAHRHMHQQGPVAYQTFPSSPGFIRTLPGAPFADEKGSSHERHAILDFSAGRDVGLGALGSNGTSVISGGVRIAQFLSTSNVNAMGRPQVNQTTSQFFHHITFYNYTMEAHAKHNFHGAGPSLSWNGSAALAGNRENGELALDWGINAAILFGRQRTRASHSTQEQQLTNHCGYYYYGRCLYLRSGYPERYSHDKSSVRSRNVAVTNLGGFAGVSFRYTNAKISLGYRYDIFLNAMDSGIDTRKTSNLTFNGPYASISIGIGD